MLCCVVVCWFILWAFWGCVSSQNSSQSLEPPRHYFQHVEDWNEVCQAKPSMAKAIYKQQNQFWHLKVSFVLTLLLIPISLILKLVKFSHQILSYLKTKTEIMRIHLKVLINKNQATYFINQFLKFFIF